MFNWFWEFLYGLIKVPLFCIDVILMVARKLCGIDPVQIEKEVNGEIVTEDVDILSYFMQADTVMSAFGYVCLFGFVLLFLFTAFRLVRDQLTFYDKKSPVRICLDASKIVLVFLLVPAIMIVGTLFVSTLMRGIFEATANGNEGLGGSMFVLFAEEAYTGPAENKQAVLDAFRTCSLEEYVHGGSLFSYYNTEIVMEYFKLSKFNFFLGLVGSISVLILLALTILSFVERIISMILLFVIAPLPMSVAPLDDGERFKMWREQTINKFITAYGGLLALNVFSLLIPMISNMKFFALGGAIGNIINGIARLLFIIGGAFACRRGMVLIGNLVSRGAGSQDLMDQSHLSGGMAALGHMAGGLVKGAVGMVGGAMKAGVGSAKSLAQAAGRPTGVADLIRAKHANSGEGKKAVNEENRFDGKLKREQREDKPNMDDALDGLHASGLPQDLLIKDHINMIEAEKKKEQQSQGKSLGSDNEMNKSAQRHISSSLKNKLFSDSKDDEKNNEEKVDK
jgi:hypothetical protein